MDPVIPEPSSSKASSQIWQIKPARKVYQEARNGGARRAGLLLAILFGDFIVAGPAKARYIGRGLRRGIELRGPPRSTSSLAKGGKERRAGRDGWTKTDEVELFLLVPRPACGSCFVYLLEQRPDPRRPETSSPREPTRPWTWNEWDRSRALISLTALAKQMSRTREPIISVIARNSEVRVGFRDCRCFKERWFCIVFIFVRDIWTSEPECIKLRLANFRRGQFKGTKTSLF